MQKKRIRREERYDQLINSATKVFSKKGYNSTTTKDISKAAGVSEKLIYIHFKSKQDLFMKCLEAVEREMKAGYGSILHEYHEDPIACLEQIAMFQYDYLKKKKYASGIVSFSAREVNNKAIRDRYKEIIETYANIIETIVKRAVDKGFMPKTVDPKAYAWLYTGNYSTFLLMEEFGFIGFNRELAEKVVNILVREFNCRRKR